ncbi:MAG: hypothetical protein IJN91_02785 [Alphaproteobacteria bacterium]|nr:hypothetical protein [Alphaproteobacteria bacterium]
MNKYLLGVLIGLGTIGTTYASIVSRGFLDEALTSYATTTALDLKADKADLMTVSDTIEEWNKIANIGGGLDLCSNMNLDGIVVNGEMVFNSCYYTNNVSDLIKRFVPYMGQREGNWFIQLLELSTRGYTKGLDQKIKGLETLTSDIEDLNIKIGTLPDGYETVGAALTAINAKVDNKIENLSETASAGKYVLTAVRVGDQTTYAWELIDRSESEATTTTTTE